MTTKEKETILKLLEVYKEMQFLWNKTHQDYSNRDRRSEGHKVLLEIYRNVDANATVKTLGKKIQNLRTNYLKELDKKQVLLSIIDMYKEMEYLWKKEHKDYSNKDKREKGFRELLRVYRNYDEHATAKHIKKKIENMRTNYVKELKKVLASEQAGEEVYEPTLWYFNAMSFLGNRPESRHHVTVSDPLENVETSLDYDDESVSSASSAKRIKRDPPIEKQILIPKSPPKVVANSSRSDDRWESYGKTIGYQVKDLSEHQLVICQKLISDAIFYAKLNKLNENSHIVNPSEMFPGEDGNTTYDTSM